MQNMFLTVAILQNVPGAAFTHMNGQRNPVDVSPDNLFPYLLVNIGSGVSILKVVILHRDAFLEVHCNVTHMTICY
jgi:pantothenate kinase